MKIEITTASSVYLSDENIRKVTISKLLSMVYPGEYLSKKKGKLVVMQDDSDHRHGSISEVYVRDASPLDLAVFEVLQFLI